ncbi:DUF58 domain-containing protein [Methylophilus aquaticus]|uniref:DUF58 domain-containing protein n=1 Tax=Methylophilus aquaticus TaxID=1971610 RepID=A0ABT9JVW4_9PROT|nr:DUF58 domain-containing protein [Methylophilus aquaticus]MDP8568225.1 DUF58 domain-containing protein [Methylophilus aquaticus]
MTLSNPVRRAFKRAGQSLSTMLGPASISSAVSVPPESSGASALPSDALSPLPATGGLNDRFDPALFTYQVNWRSVAYHAGAYLTRHQGAGSDFAGFSPLLASPDPRRVDVRASLRSIPQQLMVRTFLERGAIRVFALLDVSSSMQFEGMRDQRQQMTELAAAIAWSATRQGDAFGLLAADDSVQAALTIPTGYQQTLAQQVATQCTRFWQQRAAELQPCQSAAMPQAAASLGAQRALVFLISDFYWSAEQLARTLTACEGHDVVPLVLRDPAAFEQVPAFGWARVRDMETGQETGLMLRPALQSRMHAHAKQQRALLSATFARHGTRPPLWLAPQWRPEQLSQHLLETCA